MKLIELAQQTFPEIGRNRIKTLISDGRIVANGKVIRKATAEVEADCRLTLAEKRKEKPVIGAGLTWVWEDEWLIVVEKAAGLLSAPVGQGSISAKSLLDAYFMRTHQRCRAHLVHRLDRETSGVMVFAKHIKAEQILEHEWHERVTDRRYVALLEACPPKSEGIVMSFLKENSAYYVYSSPTENGGKRAVTHYRVLKDNLIGGRALVELRLETGRKNQIRVHMKDIGCAVCGDYKYGSGDNVEGRLCLHAFRLNFFHPITNQLLSFETRLPKWGTKKDRP